MPGNSFKDRELASRAGKMKGKHERTKQWEALQEKIIGECTDRVIEYLDSLPPDKMFQAYLDLLEYFKPKLSRAEIQADIKTEITDSILKAFDEVDNETVQPES